MSGKLEGWDDTIVALATPPGIGAIGVIRLSGARAWNIAAALFPSKNLLVQAPHTLHVGFLSEGGVPLDEAVVSLFRGPRSYTGEDVVELSCHGSPYVQQQVIQACIRQGARMARAGEFTQRAFLHGKMDLTQAEAVADLIASNTEASRLAALNDMRGGFSHALRDLREQLIRFSALIELELDFSQEDVEFADRTAFYRLITEAAAATHRLLQSFGWGNVVKNGVKVAIVGRPNAGKSTLLNTLLNDNRAIVSDIAGTTRDTIEETLQIDGVLFRLIDTAGIREHTTDVIESIGIERSRAAMAAADVVVYLLDLSAATVSSELVAVSAELSLRGKPYLLVGNKADIAVFEPFDGLLRLSALDAGSVEQLKRSLVGLVSRGAVQKEDVIVTNARHFAALQQVAASLQEIRAGLDSGLPGDLLALDIRRCLYYLGEITGEVSSEDLLGFIFERFCIGK
jgi:tRNA modification GTPase